MKRRWPRVLLGVAVLLVLAGGGGAAYLNARLRHSLPLARGEHRLGGLEAPVSVERDALGVPVIRGRSRVDVARATGFVHAQERFFQMDLLRRRAAGELAAFVGPAALPSDREVRVLQLRSVAREAVAKLPAEERALLDAYTDGANAGLGALGASPFEYLLLRSDPEPWRPEDSLLCALTMYLTLQGDLAGQESALGLMHDLLPPALFEFLTPKGTEWDAPLLGEPFVQPAVPGPDVVDLRRQVNAAAPSAFAASDGPRLAAADELVSTWLRAVGAAPHQPGDEPPHLGSNNWAVGGAHTKDGGSLVANDMHLGLSVPNTWYRASLVYQANGVERRVTGVTLPGAPYVVVGSNGRVAWGFTNSEGDWADLVVLEADPNDADAYRTAQGPRRFEHASEMIRVKGGAAERLEVLKTIWGPVVDKDHAGRRRALAWVALREGGVNAALARMEAAASLTEAQAIAPACGIPNQNFTAGDAGGHVGWTIIGRIPRRFGRAGRLPVSWADGTSGWDGWLRGEEYPRVVDPPSGRIWTANARVADGENLAKVGFGGYALGARQRQIRDALLALDQADEAEMLRLQLDDRALFLGRWQALLLRLLTPQALEGQPLRAEARRFVESWGARAAIDSVGYRVVRGFRGRTASLAFSSILAPCVAKDAGFDYLGTHGGRGHRQYEGPLWALVTQQPPHLLDPRFATWDALLLAALDSVLEELTKDEAPLAERTWGQRNTTLVQHPLSKAVPALSRLLDMPREALPGDSDLPRFQSPGAGASERLVVSPGHEQRAFFHMPTGQSGHPLSPHYADGHEAWARGTPTPFLPGPSVDTLTLLPAP